MLTNSLKVINVLYDKLKNMLDNLIKDEYNSFIQNGLSQTCSICIFNFLYDELSNITKYTYRNWCEQTTSTIIANINLCIVGLKEINKLLYLTEDELSKLLYRIITYQLYEEKKINGFLDNIFYYESNDNELDEDCDILSPALSSELTETDLSIDSDLSSTDTD